MKKRIVLVALLVVPMGIALAYTRDARLEPQKGYITYEDYLQQQQDKARLGTQTGHITTSEQTGSPSYSQQGEAMLGTQRATIRPSGK